MWLFWRRKKSTPGDFHCQLRLRQWSECWRVQRRAVCSGAKATQLLMGRRTLACAVLHGTQNSWPLAVCTASLVISQMSKMLEKVIQNKYVPIHFCSKHLCGLPLSTCLGWYRKGKVVCVAHFHRSCRLSKVAVAVYTFSSGLTESQEPHVRSSTRQFSFSILSFLFFFIPAILGVWWHPN